MPKIKLTENRIAKFHAPDLTGKQQIYWDTSLPGFGVLVSGQSDAKTYVVQRVLGKAKKTRRVTVDRTDVLTLAEARERAKGLLADIRMGIDPNVKMRGGVTLRAALDEFLKRSTHLRPRSATAYRYNLERHLKSWLDKPLRGITREMVEDELQKISKSVRRNGEHSGHAAANGTMRALRAVYNFAADRAAGSPLPLPPNPVRLKKVWLKVEPRSRRVEDEELPKFYSAVMALENKVARDYVLLLLFTGLRRREAAGLKWGNVDFDKKMIRLPSAVTKSGKPLDLPMTDFVQHLLVERRQIGKTDFVFPAPSKSKHIEEPKFAFGEVGKACGVRVSAHDMRRTFITIAESCEISHFALKGLVNHSLGRDITAQYIQMAVERLREPAQKVTDRIKELCRIEPPGGENVVGIRG